jgi:hypothetical protein
MNSKRAKLLRKVGKVDKKAKKLYNSLSKKEKEVLGDFYQFVKAKDEIKK